MHANTFPTQIPHLAGVAVVPYSLFPCTCLMRVRPDKSTMQPASPTRGIRRGWIALLACIILVLILIPPLIGWFVAHLLDQREIGSTMLRLWLGIGAALGSAIILQALIIMPLSMLVGAQLSQWERLASDHPDDQEAVALLRSIAELPATKHNADAKACAERTDSVDPPDVMQNRHDNTSLS